MSAWPDKPKQYPRASTHWGQEKYRSVSAGFLWCKSVIKASCKANNPVKVKEVGKEAQAHCRWQYCVGGEQPGNYVSDFIGFFHTLVVKQGCLWLRASKLQSRLSTRQEEPEFVQKMAQREWLHGEQHTQATVCK